MAFKVIRAFRDLQDKNKSNPTGRLYQVGDPFPATKRKVNEERITELATKANKNKQVYIEEVGE